MAEDNSDLFGKRIYFLAPQYSVRNHVIHALRDMEYEVYIIEKYHDLKNLLRKNPNSICFINIDGQLSIYGWYVFISDFKEDEVLKTIKVGLLSDKITDSEKSYFLQNLDIPAGIIQTTGQVEKLTVKIADILEMHNAKGRRQYVRANCLHDRTATIFWTQNGTLQNMKLVDISVVGAAVKLEPTNDEVPQVNSVIRSATLKLGTRQYIIDFVVYGVHQRGDKQLMITLFVPETTSGFKTAFQNYIYELLQNQAMAQISTDRQDERPYNQLGKNIAEVVHQEEVAKKKQEALEKAEKKKAEASQKKS